MSNALHPAEPTQIPRQGVAARCLRRLGGAVRGALAGLPLAGRRRRPATPQPSRTSSAPTDLPTPNKPTQQRAPRRPRAAAPAAPPASAARPGWIARWFGLTRHHPAPLGRPPAADNDDAPYTPETHPGFTPEICEILNTRVEDCDPELLRLVLAVFAQHLAEELPPELGLDVRALFSTLCDCFGAADSETAPHAPPAEPPVPPDAEQPASPEPALQPEPAEPADDPAVATSAITPDAASAAGPVARGNRPPFARGRPFRHRSVRPRCRSAVRRSLPGRPHAPPPRRLCYAACAGPP